MGYGPGGWGSGGECYRSQARVRPGTKYQHLGDHLSCPLPQDYELFVEAVEQNTLQEFLKLA